MAECPPTRHAVKIYRTGHIRHARTPRCDAAGLTAMARAWRPRRSRMVLEADAAALVVDVAVALALRGHPARITHENGPRLVRLGALMIDAFCTARETTEDNDG